MKRKTTAQVVVSFFKIVPLVHVRNKGERVLVSRLDSQRYYKDSNYHSKYSWKDRVSHIIVLVENMSF